MKALRVCFACAVLLACSQSFGGIEQPSVATATEEFNPQRFELALESGYLFGAIHYFGFNLGMRYNFVQRGSRFVPYISGGVGAGWIDSHPEVPGGQGQDFTFNILSAAGISYIVNDHWKVSVGALYQHLSNGGQTDPNPSLNLFGPQVDVNYSF